MCYKGFLVILAILVLGGSIGGCNKKTEEEKGKGYIEKKADYVKGIGEGLKDKGQAAGEAFGEGVTKTIKGIGHGVDNASGMDIRLTEDLRKTGVKATRLQQMENQQPDNKKTNGMSVYIVCSNGFSGHLLMKAFDRRNNEIGRSNAKVGLKTNDAGFVDFIFDKRVELSSAQYFTLEKAADDSCR